MDAPNFITSTEARLSALEDVVRSLARQMEELEVRLARRLAELEKGGK